MCKITYFYWKIHQQSPIKAYTQTQNTYLWGKKELFEGLKIMDLEKDWKHYPVIRLDENFMPELEQMGDQNGFCK